MARNTGAPFFFPLRDPPNDYEALSLPLWAPFTTTSHQEALQLWSGPARGIPRPDVEVGQYFHPMTYSRVYTNTPGGRLGKDPGERIHPEDLDLGPGSLVGPVLEVEHSEKFVTLIVEHESSVIYLSINAWSAKRGQM